MSTLTLAPGAAAAGPRRPAAQGTIAVLDIGSSKIACLIGEARGESVQVLGHGLHASAGIRGGQVVTMEAARLAIAEAVQAAERRAGLTVQQVLLGVGGGSLSGRVTRLTLPLGGQRVTQDFLRRAVQRAGDRFAAQGQRVLHAIPRAAALDGVGGILDPRGMAGETLELDLVTITISAQVLRVIEDCVRANHLEVAGVAASPVTSALAAVDQEERRLGVTVLDLGGGTSSITVFRDGLPVALASLPVGGGHITADLAAGLSTPLQEAERLKVLHGSAIAGMLDDQEEVAIPAIGDDAPRMLPLSDLHRVLAPRAEETLELLRDRLAAMGEAGRIGGRIVLTGGAAQLPGLADLVTEIFGRPAILGRRARFADLPKDLATPAGSAVAGLLSFGLGLGVEPQIYGAGSQAPSGMIGRISQWLRTHF